MCGVFGSLPGLFDEERVVLEYIESHGEDVLLHPSFAASLNEKCVISVLSSDFLMCKESKVFQAVCLWGQEQLKQRGLPINDAALAKVSECGGESVGECGGVSVG